MPTHFLWFNRGGDIHATVAAAITPSPDPADIYTVVRIVQLDRVGYSPGETPAFILARLLDRIEETIVGVHARRRYLGRAFAGSTRPLAARPDRDRRRTP
ncbi:hypothetical protein ACFU44_22980 [Nocardia rhizosphaerihabitans]|uniref:hypothetical protein n=1 Tax=Nocardia rhizosphaerihabitans TaxID=1691570 RepID=UPI003671D1A2